MKYILNRLPEKTTNNFKVNNLVIDLDLSQITNKNDFNIVGSDKLIIEKKFSNKKINSRIGLQLSDYFEVNITIPKNVKIDNSVLIEYDFLDGDFLVDRINFIYEEESSCNFIVTYKSCDKSMCTHHLFESVKSCENSTGNITFINLMNDKSINLMAIENDVFSNSSITHNILDIGGNVRIYNVYSNVFENGKNYLNNIYLGNNDNLIDMNYYLNNNGINSSNIMRVEGVLDGSAKKVFRGTIDFIEGCTNSIGDENENCILLSNKCISRSLLQMLCHEESVVGSHGVSSGRIDEDKLFYIMTHGYSKRAAEKLIVMAKFNEIIKNISDSKVIDEVQNIIEEKLS